MQLNSVGGCTVGALAIPRTIYGEFYVSIYIYIYKVRACCGRGKKCIICIAEPAFNGTRTKRARAREEWKSRGWVTLHDNNNTLLYIYMRINFRLQRVVHDYVYIYIDDDNFTRRLLIITHPYAHTYPVYLLYYIGTLRIVCVHEKKITYRQITPAILIIISNEIFLSDALTGDCVRGARDFDI